jgi:hypothetical protein
MSTLGKRFSTSLEEMLEELGDSNLEACTQELEMNRSDAESCETAEDCVANLRDMQTNAARLVAELERVLRLVGRRP